MSKFGISIKILIGYATLATVLAVATWLVYDNSRSLSAVNKASEELVRRRDVVDSLVCSMLETSNAERSVLMGNGSEWPRFDRSLSTSADKAKRLGRLISDSVGRQRLDTLVVLMRRKRANTLLVMDMLAANSSDSYYRDKVEALQSGRDSVVIHPKAKDRTEQRETVYEIVRSKRGFFRRLADAFRRQHSDTVGMTSVARAPLADSVEHDINIADTVANVLADIRREERKASSRRQDAVNQRMRSLQQVSLQLSRRTGLLLEDIQHDEHQSLRQAVDGAMESRHRTVARIAVMGLLAILSAAVLLVFILRDMKRERRDRRRIVEAKAETERVMQQRERLLLTITHDIKAPAASIAGFAELLGQHVDRPKAVACLGNIRQSAEHLQQLVSALLDYHQLESGKVQAHNVSFVPAKMAGDCVGEFMPLARAKGLELTLRAADCCGGMWRGDAFRLRQVLSNLVGNAIKYTDRGSVAVGVDIVRGNIVMSVKDSGCGMSQADQQRVFDAFTRLPGAQGKDGVGLGLSITREIVAMLGGTIRLTSQKGQGTTFVVVIPTERDMRQGGHGTCSTDTTDSDTLRQSATPQPLLVLAVDDDALQLQLLREMLTNVAGADITLITTQSAAEATALTQARRPQVIFTDIEMPEASGCDMPRRLNGCGAKIIAMTAHDKSIMSELRSSGFNGCLFKPFTTATLAAVLMQATGLRLRVEVPRPQADASFFAPLTAFAEGDKGAERDILTQFGNSLNEYLSLLDDVPGGQSTATGHSLPSTENIAKAAHKAMPILAMLTPGQSGWIEPLTPERIGSTPPAEVITLAQRLRDELRGIMERLNRLTGQ